MDWFLFTLFSDAFFVFDYIVMIYSLMVLLVTMLVNLASLAQLGEHLIQSWEVLGSIPGQVQWVARPQ